MGIIYKPATRKGPVLLSPDKFDAPTITLPDGRVIKAVPANQRGGIFYGEGNYQWAFPQEVLNQRGAVLSYGGEQQTLDNTNLSYRGDKIGSLQESSKGAIGAGPTTPGYNGPPGFAPNQTGYGAYPGYLGGEFPSPVLAKYSPIKSAPYNFTDPFKFAETYGQFNRGEIQKNFSQAQDLALQSLSTELKGLTSFIPAASALKRQEISIDNQFNQQQRTQQIESTLPGFVGGINEDLAGQRSRAQSFASGRIPDQVADAGLEIGLRSQAADRAAAGGFGARSSVSRKASDLLSAEERVNLSRYGDQLLTSNVGQREKFADFQLAPTEYSNAGGQVQVNPSVSGAALTQNNLAAITGFSGLPTSQAFPSQIQQNQFVTGQQQQTNMFNASNKLQLSEFNANNRNQFALDLFGYKVGYANAAAGAAQTDINTNFQLQQQQMAQQLMQQYLSQAQNSQQVGSIFNAVGSLFGGLGGIGSLTNFGSGMKANAGPGGIPLTGAAQKGNQLASGVGDVIGGVGHAIGGVVGGITGK